MSKYNPPKGCAAEALAIFYTTTLIIFLFTLIWLALYASKKISYWVYWCYDSIIDKMTEDELYISIN